MLLNEQILETLHKMYIREDGLVRAEIEYILDLHFKDTKKINEILANWNKEEEE